ncbi:MAG: BON domain-containing protein [Planctomycetota bacterium]
MRYANRPGPFRLWWATTLLVLLGGCLGGLVAAEELDDDDIRHAVRREFMLHDNIPQERIDIAVDDGTVTLDGRVRVLLSRRQAVQVASHVKGVREIVDMITVDPKERADVRIERDVEAALINNATADNYQISVAVDDAAVQLEGVVDSWQEQAVAARLAMGVAGVAEVDNQLRVARPEERDDTEIATDIRSAFRWNVYLQDNQIEVAVDDGAVRLTGSVGSAYEKDLAQSEAWVAGVESLDPSGLEVRWFADEPNLREGEVEAAAADTVAAIERALTRSAVVDAQAISVSVEEGTATLDGEVATVYEKQAAERRATTVSGVWRVINHLRVVPESEQTGAVLAEEVRDAIRRDPWVELDQVDVAVDGGTVRLGGKVDSSFERRKARMAVSRIPGVVEINNAIEIGIGGKGETSPIYDYGSFYGYDYRDYDRHPFGAQRKTDAELRKDVEDELFWSPIVEHRDIAVSVDDGTVTLTGTVESWPAYWAARRNAREAGADAVITRLELVQGPETRGSIE